MKAAASSRIIYWSATTLVFIFEGVVPALTSNSQLAIEGIRHLGYPDYFRVMLTICKVAGAVVLMLPMISLRVKEWAYAGFAFTLISAAVSHWAVEGFSGQVIFPLAFLGILMLSYAYRRKVLAIGKQAGKQELLRTSETLQHG